MAKNTKRSVGMEGEPSNRIRKHQRFVSRLEEEEEEEEPTIRNRKRQRASLSNRIRRHQRVISSSESETETFSSEDETSDSEGEEESNRIRRHQRVISSSESETETSSSEDETSSSEEEEAINRNRSHQRVSSSEFGDEISDESNAEQGATHRDGSISITSTDPQLLDCFICFQSLTIPSYQCENGHLVCSICCLKVRNKCPTCASPAGYSRCRVIEKVLESVKVLCRNNKYGCQEAFSYCMKQKHENSCPFVPCSCPMADCYVKATSKQLRRHFSTEHKKSAKHFRYDRSVSITLGVQEKMLILQEETDGSLLVLNNKIETLGNVITLSRIGSSKERSLLYELTAKDVDNRTNTLRLKSLLKSRPERVDSQASSGFLFVPSQFSCTSRQIQFDLRFPGYHSGSM